MRQLIGAFLVITTLAARAGIQTAGELLVNVSASSLSALEDNTTVSAWTNSVTPGSQFVPVISGQGAVYQTSVAGAAAVTFAGSANSVMTNTVLPPSSILGANIWSAEIWVHNPTLENPEDQFSWTQRGDWTGDASGTCMEIRYCADGGNAVEHYGPPNIPWSGTPPTAGFWHHVVITRDSGGVERLYADGVLRTTKTPSPLNLRAGAPFAMGGVWEDGWAMLFSGSLAKVRVHSGTLSPNNVINNYLEERSLYGVTTPPDSLWLGTTGQSLPWSDPANWLANEVGQDGRQVFIDNGGTAVLTQSVGTLSAFLPVHGGLMLSNSAALAVSAANGTLSMGSGSGKRFDLTVDAGTFDLQGGSQMIVGALGGTGLVTLNSGLLSVGGDLGLGQDVTGNGEVRLNGGTLRANSISAITPGATQLFKFNGGTLQPRTSTPTFMQGLAGAYVQAGGAIFDVSNGLSVTVAQDLLTDPVSTGGGLTKLGPGRLTLGGVNTFTENINLQGGELFFSNATGLPADYAGAITVANEGAIGYAKAGGAEQLMGKLSIASSGYLTLFSENATDTVNFSTFPNMKLVFAGVPSYTGAFTPYQGAYTFKVEGSIVATPLVMVNDGSFLGHLKITGVSGGGMALTGNSSFTGGAEIDGATVTLGHANALGLQGTPGVRDVTLRNGAVLRLEADMDINALVAARLTTDSSGILLLGAANAGKSIDLSSLPGIVVGTYETTLDYTGTLTPAANTYRLGGGNQAYSATPYHGFSASPLADSAGATAVVIGTPGIVELKAGNTYSGGTVVTNRGVLFLAADGLGAVPGSPDPDNLYVDNGVVRCGPARFTLNANRGVAVGPGGMELHPWGDNAMTVAGNLSGSGRITQTDSGLVTFAGAANTYSGSVDIGGFSLRIGDGPNFSWASTGGFVENGTLYLMTDNSGSTFGDTVSGNGSVRKEGSGTLTLTAPQAYAGTTTVDAGTLRLSATNVLPSGAGRGLVDIKPGAKLDANGGDLLVGGLAGSGTVTNTTDSAQAVYVGGAPASFSGTIDPALSLVKIGTGTQTLAYPGTAAAQVEVRAGTLELTSLAAVSGAATVADGGTLAVAFGGSGLIGEYYDLPGIPVEADFASLEALNAFLSGKTPALLSNSTGFGATFDPGNNGQNFPGVYSNGGKEQFAVRWTGYFKAEQAGSYTFATASDDGSLVFIDGIKVVDNNAMQGYTAQDQYDTRSSVTLSAGYHAIVIAFYENGGGQGLTVWVTLPGAGSDQVLPNALLSGVAASGASVGSLTGSAGGTLAFGTSGASELKIMGSDDMAFAGKIVGANTASRLIKEGAGTLTLSSGGSAFAGQTLVNAGTLALVNAGVLGPVELAASAALTVTNSASGMVFPYVTTSGYGLPGAYYDFAPPQPATMYDTQAALEAYLSAFTPDLIAGSDLAGTTFDFANNGSKFPGTFGTTPVFQVFWKGMIDIPTAGSYTFYTASDDGSMLFIDGVSVVQNNYLQGVVERSGTLTLSAGTHAIAMAFYDNGGGWGMFANIEGPGITKQLIPNSMLHPANSAIGALSGAGGVNLLSNGALLKIDEQVSSTYAGGATGPVQSGILKAGAQSLALTGNNDAFLGAWYLMAGTLQVGDGGASGTLGGTRVVTSAGSVLAFNRTGTVPVNETLTGTGLIRLDGPGEVYLTSTNAFAGQVQVNNGRLTLAPGATLGALTAISNAATIEVDNAGTQMQSALMGAVTGNGDLEVSGSGTLVLNRNNTYTGVTRVDTGTTLKVTHPNQFGGGGDVALDGGTLAVQPDVQPGTNALVSALNPGTWQINGNAIWATRSSSQWVQLTDNVNGQAGSAFCTAKINPNVPWYASFRYELGERSGTPADGITFVLQNSGSGSGSLGGGGGDLGVSGISPSIGFFLNIYVAGDPLGWIVNGARTDTVGSASLNGIVLREGVDVVLTYNGTELKLTLTQGEKICSLTRTVDLGATFGGNTTHVGFTAGTGGENAEQFVGNFSFNDMLATSTDFGNTLAVADGLAGTLKPSVLNDNAALGFAGLGLGSGAVLNVSVAAGSKADAAYTVAASNVTVMAGIGTVHLAANGTGNGVLALTKLTFGSGAKLVVTGAVSVPGGVLTVVVPTPVPNGVTQLADFTGAAWVGGAPTILLKDAFGNIVDETIVLRNGRLYINTINGTMILVR